MEFKNCPACLQRQLLHYDKRPQRIKTVKGILLLKKQCIKCGYIEGQIE